MTDGRTSIYNIDAFHTSSRSSSQRSNGIQLLHHQHSLQTKETTKQGRQKKRYEYKESECGSLWNLEGRAISVHPFTSSFFPPPLLSPSRSLHPFTVFDLSHQEAEEEHECNPKRVILRVLPCFDHQLVDHEI